MTLGGSSNLLPVSSSSHALVAAPSFASIGESKTFGLAPGFEWIAIGGPKDEFWMAGRSVFGSQRKQSLAEFQSRSEDEPPDELLYNHFIATLDGSLRADIVHRTAEIGTEWHPVEISSDRRYALLNGVSANQTSSFPVPGDAIRRIDLETGQEQRVGDLAPGLGSLRHHLPSHASPPPDRLIAKWDGQSIVAVPRTDLRWPDAVEPGDSCGIEWHVIEVAAATTWKATVSRLPPRSTVVTQVEVDAESGYAAALVTQTTGQWIMRKNMLLWLGHFDGEAVDWSRTVSLRGVLYLLGRHIGDEEPLAYGRLLLANGGRHLAVQCSGVGTRTPLMGFDVPAIREANPYPACPTVRRRMDRPVYTAGMFDDRRGLPARDASSRERLVYREGVLLIGAMIVSAIVTVSISVWIVANTDLLKSTKIERTAEDMRGPRMPASPVPDVSRGR